MDHLAGNPFLRSFPSSHWNNHLLHGRSQIPSKESKERKLALFKTNGKVPQRKKPPLVLKVHTGLLYTHEKEIYFSSWKMGAAPSPLRFLATCHAHCPPAILCYGPIVQYWWYYATIPFFPPPHSRPFLGRGLFLLVGSVCSLLPPTTNHLIKPPFLLLSLFPKNTKLDQGYTTLLVPPYFLGGKLCVAAIHEQRGGMGGGEFPPPSPELIFGNVGTV